MSLRIMLPYATSFVFAGCGGRVIIDYEPAGSSGGGGHGGYGWPTDTTSASGSGGAVGAGGSDEPADPPSVVVIANGKSTLYSVDVLNQNLLSVVPLWGCSGEIIDIAIGSTGRVFGVSTSDLYQIDPTSGECTFRGHGEYPNSLTVLWSESFDQDVLVGYREATYYRIDPMKGTLEVVGTLGEGYFSSGDMTTTADGRAYLTVRGNGCDDCLAEVHPGTGAFITLVGPLGYSHVYGLAGKDNILYGFSAGGLVLRIDPQTTTVDVLPLMNGGPGLSFWGAASGVPWAPMFLHKRRSH